MIVHKYEIVIFDPEEVGADEITEMLENVKHLYPTILSCQTADIGEWNDDHPANKDETMHDYFGGIFPSKP